MLLLCHITKKKLFRFMVGVHYQIYSEMLKYELKIVLHYYKVYNYLGGIT